MNYTPSYMLVGMIKGNSKQAKEELEYRYKNFINTGLIGINGESIHFLMTDEIVDNLKYIKDNISRLNNYESDSVEIREAIGSASIEGAHTSFEEINNIIKNNTPRKELNKSEKMVINTKKALNKMCNKDVTLDNIRDIWEIIVKDVCENEHLKGKKFRDGIVYIGSSFRIVHVPCDVENIEDKIHQLFYWIGFKDLDILIKSCIIHFYLAYIHPFCDGNGRLCRNMQIAYLYKNGYENIKKLAMSEKIYENVEGYYGSLRHSEKAFDRKLDITPFINYMLNIIIDSMEDKA